MPETKTIKLFATLRDLTGCTQIQVPFEDGQTVRELLRVVCEQNPALAEKIVNENGEMTGLVHIFVEGRNIQWLQGLDTIITTDDTLVMMPPAAGG